MFTLFGGFMSTKKKEKEKTPFIKNFLLTKLKLKWEGMSFVLLKIKVEERGLWKMLG